MLVNTKLESLEKLSVKTFVSEIATFMQCKSVVTLEKKSFKSKDSLAFKVNNILLHHLRMTYDKQVISDLKQL